MAEIVTLKGTYHLAEAAYAAGVKLGAGAKDLEQERHAREAVYGYFMQHPDDLVVLVNAGFLSGEDLRDADVSPGVSQSKRALTVG